MQSIRVRFAGTILRLCVPPTAFLIGLCFGPDVAAYTPDSPPVQAAVDRGIAYLEKSAGGGGGESGTNSATDVSGETPGSVMLAGYTHHKVRHEPNNAVVQRGVQAARRLAATVRAEGRLEFSSEITYETAVAILLLIDVDKVAYSSDIQVLGNALIAVQKPHGGFGYLNESDGDTSQTQYCVLAMWTMDQADFPVPKPAMRRAVEWLLKTQDPSGRWTYKGKPANRIGELVPQEKSRQTHSITSAGAGSVLIGTDFFSLWRSSSKMKSDVEGLPTALKEQEDAEEARAKREAFNIPDDTVMQFINRTEQNFRVAPYKRPGGRSWHYYYLYTLERYKSFLEVARGAQEAEPAWYNEGVEMILAAQSDTGGWGLKGDSVSSSPQVATSFAILFLIRSTKKAIGELGEGVMSGGYKLPSRTKDLRVEGSQIKAPPSAVVVTDLLGLLEKDGMGNLDAGSLPENLRLATDPAEQKKQLSRLERVARGSDSYKKRQVAVRLLAQSDSLEAVPTLIFALTDPDKTTRRYARDGLRFISRRFTGFGMPLDIDPRENEAKKAIDAWKAWYLTVDPGYVFYDF